MALPDQRCERCDLPVGQCEHSRVVSGTPQRKIMVSPRFIAHFEGCPHKGEDPDLDRWGEILDVPRAWERLGTGEEILTNAGKRVGLPAKSRCKDCEYAA